MVLIATSSFATIFVSGTRARPPPSLPGLGARPAATTATASTVTRPGTSRQNGFEVVGNGLYVPKVAETALATLAHFKLPTGRLSEVGHGAEVHVDGPEHVPAVVEVFGGLHGVLLLAELDVDVATEMVALVVAHAHFFDFAILFFALEENVLKEILELLLNFVVTHVSQMRTVSTLG